MPRLLTRSWTPTTWSSWLASSRVMVREMSNEVMRVEWVNIQKMTMVMVMVMDETWLLWQLTWMTWLGGEEPGVPRRFWGSEPRGRFDSGLGVTAAKLGGS